MSKKIVSTFAHLQAGSSSVSGVGTVTPAVIIDAIEKSELSLTEQTILITCVMSVTNTGIFGVKELLSWAYESLTDNPELVNKLIEIIESIKQSC